MPPPRLHKPPEWTNDELERDRQRAIDIFRRQRVEEPLETYGEAFDARRSCWHMLLDAQTRGLTLFWAHSLEAQLLDWILSTRTA